MHILSPQVDVSSEYDLIECTAYLPGKKKSVRFTHYATMSITPICPLYGKRAAN